jgi:1-deoxy-D-xylulose-5-phosphate reductoisomerase
MGDNEAVTSPRSVAILGSTGSIGTQALDVVARNPGRFRVTALSAGSNLDLLAEQAVAFDVDLVAVATGTHEAVAEAIAAYAARAGRAAYRPQVVVGDDAAVHAARFGADVVLNGITGSIGLRPTLAALAAGSTLALANKESLIVGGPLVRRAAAPGQIVPVDSEHSAIAQCLRAGTTAEVRRLVVTASGGPFRGRSRADLERVTVTEALAHPNFAMGPVITTNSATLVNKGLEVIEAHLLFGIPYDRIEVVVHPQSVIHSMVTFVDGSTMAQASPPDMRLPIALALAWPHRLDRVAAACDFTAATGWTFEPVDRDAFPALDVAIAAGMAGGTVPAAFNAANEEAVAAFRHGHLRFTGISDLLSRILDEADHVRSNPRDVHDVWATEDWARVRAREMIGSMATGSTGKQASTVWVGASG